MRNGKTDLQWFGPALPDVARLREGVAKYLAGIAKDSVILDQKHETEPVTIVDEKGEQIGVPPYRAAQFLLIAANEITTKNIPGVEAFSYFYAQQMYPALMEVVLPDVPAGYRADVIRFLYKQLRGETLFRPDVDEPMFGIAPFMADDDDDEEEEEAPVAPPPVAPIMKSARAPVAVS